MPSLRLNDDDDDDDDAADDDNDDDDDDGDDDDDDDDGDDDPDSCGCIITEFDQELLVITPLPFFFRHSLTWLEKVAISAADPFVF